LKRTCSLSNAMSSKDVKHLTINIDISVLLVTNNTEMSILVSQMLNMGRHGREKRNQNVLCNILWNSGDTDEIMVYRFLNKFAAKQCERFPSHLNNVSTLPCETWKAHRIGVTEINSRIYSTSTVTYCQRKWAKHDHWSGAVNDVTDEWLPQWRHDPAWPTPFSVAFQFVQINDDYFVHLRRSNTKNGSLISPSLH